MECLSLVVLVDIEHSTGNLRRAVEAPLLLFCTCSPVRLLHGVEAGVAARCGGRTARAAYRPCRTCRCSQRSGAAHACPRAGQHPRPPHCTRCSPTRARPPPGSCPGSDRRSDRRAALRWRAVGRRGTRVAGLDHSRTAAPRTVQCGIALGGTAPYAHGHEPQEAPSTGGVGRNGLARALRGVLHRGRVARRRTVVGEAPARGGRCGMYLAVRDDDQSAAERRAVDTPSSTPRLTQVAPVAHRPHRFLEVLDGRCDRPRAGLW